MTITFSHRETSYGDNMLCIKTNQHVNVEFLFDKGDYATHVYLDGDEFPLTSDTLYGLFVAIGEEVISLIALSHKANRAYPDIMVEIEQEAKENDSMVRELSCPRMTGRI